MPHIFNSNRRGSDASAGSQPRLLDPRAGVVMVEAAMAVLVLAIGIISVFLLFRGGFKRTAEAAADTQTALFADSVLNGLKAAALRADEADPTNGWTRFWVDLDNGSNVVSVASPYAWTDDVFIRQGEVCTNVFGNNPLHGGAGGVINHSLRYLLDVTLLSPAPPMPGVALVALTVWPGEFGSTNASIFYTEVRKPDLW